MGGGGRGAYAYCKLEPISDRWAGIFWLKKGKVTIVEVKNAVSMHNAIKNGRGGSDLFYVWGQEALIFFICLDDPSLNPRTARYVSLIWDLQDPKLANSEFGVALKFCLGASKKGPNGRKCPKMAKNWP